MSALDSSPTKRVTVSVDIGTEHIFMLVGSLLLVVAPVSLYRLMGESTTQQSKVFYASAIMGMSGILFLMSAAFWHLLYNKFRLAVRAAGSLLIGMTASFVFGIFISGSPHAIRSGLFGDALVLQSKVDEIGKEAYDNGEGRASLFAKLGDFYTELGKPDMAEMAYSSALKFYLAENNQRGTAGVLVSQALVEIQQDEIASAEDRLKTAGNIYDKLNDVLGKANVNSAQGRLLIKSKKFSESVALLVEAGKELEKSEDQRGFLSNLIYLSIAKSALGKPAEASSIVERAYGLAIDREFWSVAANAATVRGDQTNNIAEKTRLYAMAAKLFAKAGAYTPASQVANEAQISVGKL